jgi:alcohol dehydrogenase (cytochrome c)
VNFRNAILAGLLLSGATPLTTAQVPTADQSPRNPDPKDWPTYAGTDSGQRHSPLKQITAANASRLQPKWVYHVDGVRGMEQTPVVMDGVMYISQINRMDAIDARTGNIFWKYQRQPASGTPQRGTAVYGTNVYMVTSDSHLVALDTRNGAVRWETKAEGGYVLSGAAPIIARGKVIVSGNRPNGFIQAYDAETGKYAWTWAAIPKPGEPAAETWGGSPPAGAPIWVSGSFDPQLNLLYYGTGQPNPQWTGFERPGDNLYSDCIVALNADTGKLVWFFQNTPHDTHDWDSLETPVLVDGVIRGQPRKLLLQANRNGFYYILDRTNGEFLSGTPFVNKVDWTTGLDDKGRPIVAPGHDPSVRGTITCPSTAGATNWPSPTYNPDTHYFYVTVAEGCGVNFITSSTAPDAGTGYIETANAPWQAYVVALNAFTGKRAWEYKEVRSNHYGPGLLSTAGGIVFAPEQFGQVTVLDAKSGKPVWHFNTGDLITASPMTYSVDGQQFFAIASGTNVFAFGLQEVNP